MWVLIAPPVGCVQFPLIHLPLCAGHGRCMAEGVNGTLIEIHEANQPNSQCICDPGWSGYNDFVDLHTHDCSINTATIRVIWSLILVVSLVALGVTFHKLFCSFRRFQELEKEKGERGNSTKGSHHSDGSDQRSTPLAPSAHPLTPASSLWGYWKPFFHWPVVRMCLLTLIPIIPLIALAFYKLINTEGPGINVIFGTTVLYQVHMGGVRLLTRYQSTEWLNLRETLFRFTDENQRQTQKVIHRLRKMTQMAYFPEFLEAVLSFTLCFYQQQANLLMFIWFNLQLWSNLQVCYAFHQAATAITNILSQPGFEVTGSQKEAREKALARLKHVRDHHARTAQGALPYMIMIAWWPWLRGKMAYGNFLFITVASGLALQITLLHPPALEKHVPKTSPKKKMTKDIKTAVSEDSRVSPEDGKEEARLLTTPSEILSSPSVDETLMEEVVSLNKEEDHVLKIRNTLEIDASTNGSTNGSGSGGGLAPSVSPLGSEVTDSSPSTVIISSSAQPPKEGVPIFNPFQ